MSTNEQRPKIQRPGGEELLDLIDATLAEIDAPIGDYSDAGATGVDERGTAMTGLEGYCWRCGVNQTDDPIATCETCRAELTVETIPTPRFGEPEPGGHNLMDGTAWPRLARKSASEVLRVVARLGGVSALSAEELATVEALLMVTMPASMTRQEREALARKALTGPLMLLAETLERSPAGSIGRCDCGACRVERGEVTARWGIKDDLMERCPCDGQVGECPRCGGHGFYHVPGMIPGIAIEGVCECPRCETLPPAAVDEGGLAAVPESMTVGEAVDLIQSVAPGVDPDVSTGGFRFAGRFEAGEVHGPILRFVAATSPDIKLRDYYRVFLADAPNVDHSVTTIRMPGAVLQTRTVGSGLYLRRLPEGWIDGRPVHSILEAGGMSVERYASS